MVINMAKNSLSEGMAATPFINIDPEQGSGKTEIIDFSSMSRDELINKVYSDSEFFKHIEEAQLALSVPYDIGIADGNILKRIGNDYRLIQRKRSIGTKENRKPAIDLANLRLEAEGYDSVWDNVVPYIGMLNRLVLSPLGVFYNKVSGSGDLIIPEVPKIKMLEDGGVSKELKDKVETPYRKIAGGVPEEVYGAIYKDAYTDIIDKIFLDKLDERHTWYSLMKLKELKNIADYDLSS